MINETLTNQCAGNRQLATKLKHKFEGFDYYKERTPDTRLQINEMVAKCHQKTCHVREHLEKQHILHQANLGSKEVEEALVYVKYHAAPPTETIF